MPHVPRGFDLAEVEGGLIGTRFAGKLKYLDATGSTNQLALEAGRSGDQTRVWVAGEQTAGRGRGGHSWHSAPGEGLYCSMLVADQLPPDRLSALPLAAGLAVTAAVREVSALELDLRWPNDLMAGERKCGGILVESALGGVESALVAPNARSRFAVVGIGLNLNQGSFPPELAHVATSLGLEDGRRHEREPHLAAILRAFDRELRCLAERPLADLYTRFEAASSWVRGKRVRVGNEGPGYTGVTDGLDRQGFLRVRVESGAIRTVLSGGVRPE